VNQRLHNHARTARAAKHERAAVRLGVAMAMALAFSGGSAMAQSVGSAQAQSVDLFARDRSVSVLQRPRPDYEAIGFSKGAFAIYPRVVLETEYNDNVFAVTRNPQEDVIFRVRPEATAESQWSRHSLRGYLRGSFARNKDFGSESANDWSIGSSGRIDVRRFTNITMGADYIDATEPRSSSNTAQSAKDPIQFSLAQAYVGASNTRGRLRLATRVDVRAFNYDDGVDFNGVSIEQDNRDRDMAIVTARGDYAISPATALFVQATANKRNYDSGTVSAPQRDSKGYELLTGVNFEVGAVARGEFAVGYVSQSFNENGYGDISGFGFRTELEWFPTELTTVTSSLSRTVEDAGIVGAGGYLSTDFNLGVDHELLRNLILSAKVAYSHDAYNGIDRTDNRTVTSLRGNYLLNRHAGLSLTYSHTDQDSKGVTFGPNYGVNLLTLSLTTQF